MILGKMIIVEKEIYSQWCKSHPTAIGLFGKPFPHFDSLDIVFGKDKTSGNAVGDIVDMHAEIEKEYFPSTQGGGSGINLNDDEDDFESQIPETLTANTTTPGSNPTNLSQRDSTNYRTGKRGGKRVKHNDDASDSLLTSVNKLGEFYACGVENMKQLSSCFMHEKFTAERRNQIVSILNEIQLPAKDVVRAAMLITKDNNLCDCFFRYDTPELRKEFVGMVLSSNGFQ
ncbi:myb/SANT-like DNA-binding domain protein [Trifolium medium]|uniref:Myb/SANT-like DNA-binding domain protein n=1 Tax=Trifolium medium TaxID=97028 RepID=A0A392MVB4_9FABA|nr:myb/SANT-like DNA-binding domain protein [Trifolium medium]